MKAMYWDQLKGSSWRTSISMEKGELREIKVGVSSDETCRAFEGGRWSYTNGKGLLGRCKSNLKLVEAPRYELGAGKPGKDYREKPKQKPSDVDFEKKMQIVNEINRRCKGKKVDSTIILADSSSQTHFTNSEGWDMEQEFHRINLTLVCIARKNDLIERGINVFRVSGGYELLDKLDLDEFVDEAADRAIGLLKARTAPAGEFRVLLDPKIVSSFVHEAVGHMAEGDNVYLDNTILKDKIGQRISAPITIIDDATLPREYGSFGVDREGVKSQRVVLVEDGIFKRFMHSRDSAGRMGGGAESTGNCRGLYGAVRMSNTFIEPGKWKLDELLEKLKNGIYLKGDFGGTALPTTGQFNFTPEEGFMVENGEIKGRLRDLAMMGNTLSTLQRIEAVGRDFLLWPGFCGKMGEFVQVSSGGPHILTKVIVGGRHS